MLSCCVWQPECVQGGWGRRARGSGLSLGGGAVPLAPFFCHPLLPPPLWGLSLVPAGVQLTSNGGLLFDEGSRDVLGEGREVAEVLQVGGARA